MAHHALVNSNNTLDDEAMKKILSILFPVFLMVGANTPSLAVSNYVIKLPSGTSTTLSAPTDLSASISGSSIILNWTRPAGDVTGNNLFLSTSSGANTPYTSVGDVSSYTFAGLTAGQSYFFKVQPVSDAGNGKTSEEVSGSFSLASAPQSLSASLSGTSNINLAWSAPSNAGSSAITGYKIYKSTNGTDVLYTTIGNQTSYSLSSLAPGYTYYFKVQAVTASGDGTLSSQASKAIPISIGAFVEGGYYIGSSVVSGVSRKLIIDSSRRQGTYATASSTCASLVKNGYSDWRMADLEYPIWRAVRGQVPVAVQYGEYYVYLTYKNQMYSFYTNVNTYTASTGNYYYHCSRRV